MPWTRQALKTIKLLLWIMQQANADGEPATIVDKGSWTLLGSL